MRLRGYVQRQPETDSANALRVSEVCGADLDDLAIANGHRTLRIVGKGGQPALIPLAPRTARAIDTAVGERTDEPLMARPAGSRLDRHAAGRIVSHSASLVRSLGERTRRQYVGPWLPEPLVSLPSSEPDPADRVTLDDSVRLALLMVLERLSPAQRTTFVLHDVFGVPFGEIAHIVGRSAPACRQLASRARRRIHDEQRFPVARNELHVIVEQFRHACQSGDLEALVATLDPDVTGEFDSGGVLPGAPTTSIAGARRVASLLLSSFDGRPVSFVSTDVNGEPGLVVILRDRIVTALTLQVIDGLVDHIHAIGNPAKLQHLKLHGP